jgi:hypothetical protein
LKKFFMVSARHLQRQANVGERAKHAPAGIDTDAAEHRPEPQLEVRRRGGLDCLLQI